MSSPPALVHVIDDDDAVRASLAFLLESAGLACRTWESAIAFLEARDRAPKTHDYIARRVVIDYATYVRYRHKLQMK